MLKVHDVSRPAGRKALAALSRSRLVPDFSALRDALPVVEEVLSDPAPPSALAKYVERFDGGEPAAGAGSGKRSAVRRLLVDPAAGEPPRVDPAFARAFRLARRRIEAYHRRQLPSGFSWRDAEGVSFEDRPAPHAAVGVYVPGGRAFYPSSLLMGVVPALVARVPRIVLATPPRAWHGSAELRWAARELGLREALLAGGAHGIAALVAWRGCTKIVGPGNRWVAAAKHLVSSVVAVDLPAGPSEVLLVASPDADPALVAADLLAQAEHDPLALCLLFATDRALVDRVRAELSSQLASLPTAPVASASLSALGAAFLFPTLDDAAAAAEGVAAEHLQLMGRGAEALRRRLLPFAGALFSGEATPTAFGDYLAGPNHTLPTGGAGRSYSGLSTRDYVRWGRSVSFTREAAASLAPAAASLARFEGLEGHARSLDLRGAGARGRAR